VQAADEREQARVDAKVSHDGRVSFLRRLLLLAAALGAAYLLLSRLRRRRSRWLPAALAAVAAVASLAAVMAIDYLTDYVNPTQLGVLVLSVVGALMTVAAFAVLQRYLARRLPERRVRRRECPFCGWPTGEHPHCEGCGRDVVAACATCSSPRRVGTRHCRVCGAA
jgi:4-amino-4-deoxy-L-arabinose transferase-like glycosyltransferase